MRTDNVFFDLFSFQIFCFFLFFLHLKIHYLDYTLYLVYLLHQLDDAEEDLQHFRGGVERNETITSGTGSVVSEVDKIQPEVELARLRAMELEINQMKKEAKKRQMRKSEI